ncbi:dTMP kinase [Helicobacter sp. 13S00477-4]|uniref:dTMP kinase n=1 Tax=Helicobacter sp. 13S00477-4 TaxID=1905759 RepID=UPI000BA5FCB3|nr:dTMP kinase [Helicobacter sp. 13S00477-4]PAF50823.1 dTMP kinase [Helicobacter sp. 13S00477-4]
MYISLEGIDTSGKSTQINLLKNAYPQAIFTKEPGGSLIGMQIREMILKENQKDTNKIPNAMDSKTEFLLFLADRAEHTAKIILPNQDKLIISDRSLISGIAYSKGIEIPQAIELNLFATGGIVPDLVIMLEIDTKELQTRLNKKSNDIIEKRGIAYLLDVQKKIKSMTEKIKSLGCELHFIDASKDKEVIHTQIKQIIDSKL